MSTQAQIKSNRRNAQRSTGPRTAEGKTRAALNALTHGLCAVKVVAGSEDSDLYQTLRTQLTHEWRPASVMEVLLIERLAELIWRVRRVAGVEVELIEKYPRRQVPGFPERFFEAKAALAYDLRSANSALHRLQVYQMRLDRGLHQTLNELRQLQIQRQMQDERPADDELREGETHTNENEQTNPILCG